MGIQIDWLNTVFIILSLILAINIPFELFLIAYAVLGPLHYLTEINWIRDKGFFTNNKHWGLLALLFALLIGIPGFLYFVVFQSLSEESLIKTSLSAFSEWTNAFIFLGLAISIILLTVKRNKVKFFLICICLALSVIFNFIPFYKLLIGLLLPTLVHVYLFTVFFMLAGTLKNNSFPGYLNIILMISIPIFIGFSNLTPTNYVIGESLKNIFIENSFIVLPAKLSGIMGFSEGGSFFFYEKTELKIQTFISFAYLYHYLNWFSKTTTIGWHKSLTTKKTIFIALIWLILVLLFWVDYKIGVYSAITFSFLHLILEFPINIISIKAICSKVFRQNENAAIHN